MLIVYFDLRLCVDDMNPNAGNVTNKLCIFSAGKHEASVVRHPFVVLSGYGPIKVQETRATVIYI